MKCPKCRKVRYVREVRDAALIYVKGRGSKSPWLRPIAGYYCEDCCHNWITRESLKSVIT